VDAIWRRLPDRSGPRQGGPLTDDPDLHLLVNGERLDPTLRVDDQYLFRLSAAPNTVRIVSRAAIPQELGLARDPRCLGVALRRIGVRRGTRLRVIEADDAMLVKGFQSFEQDNGFRRTDGDAAIPAEAFAGFTGPLVIGLTIASTIRYLDEGPACASHDAPC
jgi:hypothetical protein